MTMLLDKAATQEEFIPGSMGSAPYRYDLAERMLAGVAPEGMKPAVLPGQRQVLQAVRCCDESPSCVIRFVLPSPTNTHSVSDVGGPLMRSVKDFICRRLDMDGLVGDDFGMELLVGVGDGPVALGMRPVGGLDCECCLAWALELLCVGLRGTLTSLVSIGHTAYRWPVPSSTCPCPSRQCMSR